MQSMPILGVFSKKTKGGECFILLPALHKIFSAWTLTNATACTAGPMYGFRALLFDVEPIFTPIQIQQEILLENRKGADMFCQWPVSCNVIARHCSNIDKIYLPRQETTLHSWSKVQRSCVWPNLDALIATSTLTS